MRRSFTKHGQFGEIWDKSGAKLSSLFPGLWNLFFFVSSKLHLLMECGSVKPNTSLLVGHLGHMGMYVLHFCSKVFVPRTFCIRQREPWDTHCSSPLYPLLLCQHLSCVPAEGERHNWVLTPNSLEVYYNHCEVAWYFVCFCNVFYHNVQRVALSSWLDSGKRHCGAVLQFQ